MAVWRRRRARKIIDAVGFCLFVPIGLVWIAADEIYELVKEECKILDKKLEAKKEYKIRRALAPPASVPQKRFGLLPPRVMTMMIKRNSELKPLQIQVSTSQPNSRLLQLPGEIRNLIWEYALGGNTFHIINTENSVSHVTCKQRFHPGANLPGDIYRSCLPYQFMDSAPYHDVEMIRRLAMYASNSGALIFTCKQIYIEASDYLYSRNMFDFNSLDTFKYFRDAVQPRHFSLIQHLQLTHSYKKFEQFVPDIKRRHRDAPLYPPYDNATWKETWRMVAKEMVGLKDLRFRPQGDRSSRSTGIWRLIMLDEIRKVRGLDYFYIWTDDAFIRRNSDDPEWDDDVKAAVKQLSMDVTRPRELNSDGKGRPRIQIVEDSHFYGV